VKLSNLAGRAVMVKKVDNVGWELISEGGQIDRFLGSGGKYDDE
jgi:hypothetical protein